MSMITSCPACGTMFRVVPDQLKISEGWVRCGHCAEVFDASAHLSDESILDAPAPDDVMRPAEVPAAALEAPASELPTQPGDLPIPSASLLGRPAEPAPAPASRPVEPPSAAVDSSSFFGTDSESLEPSPLDAPFVFRPSDLIQRERGDSSFLPAPGEEVHVPPGEDEEEDEEERQAALRRVSFVRQAGRRAWWRRPMVRVLLALASLGLAALLVLQVAYQDRDRLAFAQPALRPALERMCAQLRCTLGAPRQIDAILIESSGFNRLRNDTYRLAFTLRNTAAVPVALPAMELTVTDAQDQPIARRVLTPGELGAGASIAAGGEWTRAVGLQVDAPPTARVAGYRLLAFYP